MVLSFILYATTVDTENLVYWLATIFNHKPKNWEVIIVDDDVNNGNLQVFAEYFKLYPHNCKIVTSYQVAGIATSRNLGLKYAIGEYVVFLNPIEIPSANFVSTILQVIKNNPTMDCLEYRVYYEFQNKVIFHSTIRTEAEELYYLKTIEGKSVYALTTPFLATKVMKRRIINEHNLHFRKEIQFDSLFLYSFLAHCDTYYAITDTLITCQTNLIQNDNAFELMYQWIHILNYYNNCKLRKTLHDELEYAVVRYYLYTFLNFISLTQKPALIEKVYKRIKAIIDLKFKKFRDNPYLKNINKYDLFTSYALDFPAYFKKYFQENDIKDDTKYWE